MPVAYWEFLWLNFFFKNFCMEYYWCYLDAVSPSSWEFNSLHKRYTALLHRKKYFFSENKIIRSVVGEKVDGHILFGARSENPKILFGARGEKRKIYLMPNELQKNVFGSQRVKQFSWILVCQGIPSDLRSRSGQSHHIHGSFSDYR